ncbi:MAG: DsbA family oxidoreductase [Trueperaceae bacterium]|nr:DsbA family oxidoreductase [Trueperaceae bacterium]MCC6309999.1 DsbA family oxidoreductase [Trueperaceae bacterium]MCO5174980.1 DsbA family oxidoreductase [Trueperaceae bacterium]MCW5819671.1 DsbA family oxidoreductase [Trueperaceae bacterium]
MKVEIWSDIACPWCYIGKTRFEKALAAYEHAGEVEVVWRSFELQPDAPRKAAGGTAEHLMAKYGRSRAQVLEMMERVSEVAASEGLEFHLDKGVAANTFDAHRLVHYGTSVGRGEAVMRRLMRAYQSEGEDLSDHAALARLAVEAGLEESGVREVLASDAFSDAVRADERRARTLGVDGVPFFVFDEAHGVSGAQPTEFFLSALRQLGPQVKPLTMHGAEGPVCDEDGCELPRA